MSRYVLSPRARADLEDIWAYSVKRWGTEQAEDYLRIVQKAIETVAEEPRRGRACDEVRRGYRKYAAGSHVLFYRSVKGSIDIVPILHSRMDFKQHL
ncbi:MAG TPA: type II toxin-antitoxin system RelE/ParE family toxin [Hyphomicrobiaceae bacterium]|nr:type II toxin-antitoxin system RelE/ParE family toxin [Hyphomicrobiaceae bacterium]